MTTNMPTPPFQDQRKTVLAVDDTSTNLAILGELLGSKYRVRVANSGARALVAVKTNPRPDLILLDIMMPDMDGYTVMEHLQADPQTRDIPVIFVTGMTADEDEERGLHLGAVDYVTKPIRAAILLARIETHLELKSARDRLTHLNDYLERQVERRTQENELIKDVSLNALALLAEKRDNETGNHLLRTQAYVEALIQRLKNHPRFAADLAPPRDKMIAKAAPLHDIGKVGVPDHILLKPGRLTPEEFTVMKTHSMIGAHALAEAINRVLGEGHREGESGLDFLSVARQIAMSHHEKWDGSGYPLGLSGDQIPTSARLMAIADVFDALMSRRHYKEAFPKEKVLEILTEGRGTHFDPDVFDAFFAAQDEFMEIARRYSDGHTTD